MKLNLKLLPDLFSIYKLKNLDKLHLPKSSSFTSLTITNDEFSLISSAEMDVDYLSVSEGWRCIRVDGDLPFDAVGIIASVCEILANENISLFAVCTHDRDFVLIEEKQLKIAQEYLLKAGHYFV